MVVSGLNVATRGTPRFVCLAEGGHSVFFGRPGAQQCHFQVGDFLTAPVPFCERSLSQLFLFPGVPLGVGQGCFGHAHLVFGLGEALALLRARGGLSSFGHLSRATSGRRGAIVDPPAGGRGEAGQPQP